MSLLGRLLGKNTDKKSAQGQNRQLPSSMVAKEFGEVDVRCRGDRLEVFFTILMEPIGAEAEGWQTGVALDASVSMQGAFGQFLIAGSKGELPADLKERYREQGWISADERDGRRLNVFSREAVDDARERGYFAYSENVVAPQARLFTKYLADNLDADGGTTVIYWACGDGSQIEVVGDLTGSSCDGAQFDGPRQQGFGQGTALLPAVRYFAERFADARRGMYLFITDGRIDDLPAVKAYTIKLCKDIAAERRNPLKCVLIGIGDQIDEGQMEELDDLDSGTAVDLWDHKLAKDMRGVTEIFAEVVDESQIVAPTARIFDARGGLVKSFTDGLPARVTFSLPADSHWFELEVAGRRIRQPLLEQGGRQ